MENNHLSDDTQVQPEEEVTEGVDIHVDWKTPVTTVTPLSRTLAWILFIILPIGAFLIGVEYAGNKIVYQSQTDYYIPVKIVSKDKIEVQKADDTGVTDEDVAEAVSANNQSAIDLYEEISAKEEGNLFFSPYSISTALAMTYEGASGKTAEEMMGVFGFNSDFSVRRPAMASLYNLLNKNDAPYALYTANALWVQEDYQLLPEYTDAVSQYYGGYATNVDFLNETEKARVTINDWVEENTNSKIKNFFEEGVLNLLTRLVLTNTIYFKGDWLEEFDPKFTKDDEFLTGKNETVTVSMMNKVGKDVEYSYTETDSLQVLELPYKDEELSMMVLLPKDKESGLAALEDQLTLVNFEEWTKALRKQPVDIHLPKFKLETKYNLNNTLKDLGMLSAFDPEEADFSGMSGLQDLYIGLVVHQAFVEVNEEGTEAAAATGVMMVKGVPAPTLIFRADHPFLFLIKENTTGNILFMGRVSNPLE